MLNFDDFEIEETKISLYDYIIETPGKDPVIVKICTGKSKSIIDSIPGYYTFGSYRITQSDIMSLSQSFIFIYRDKKEIYYSDSPTYIKREYYGWKYYDTCDNKIKTINDDITV